MPRPKKQTPQRAYQPTDQDTRVLAEIEARRHAAPRPVMLRLSPQKNGPTQSVVDHPDAKIGSAHLMASLGTADPVLCAHLLEGLGRIAGKGCSTADLNRLLSTVRGIAPSNPVEALLAVQMTAVHEASLRACQRLKDAPTVEQYEMASNAFNKLTRTFAQQVEALKKLRSTGEQSVIVKHVHVHAGGQAVVGHVNARRRGGKKRHLQSHEPRQADANASGATMLGSVKANGEAMPCACGEGQGRVPVSRRQGRGA